MLPRIEESTILNFIATREINMEYSYFSDSLQNYLVLACPEPKNQMGYQYRMLAVNTIRGLLPSSLRVIDGIQYLYYDITSRQDLQSLYLNRYIPEQTWQNLLRCLARTGKTLARFLLDEKRLLLAPEFIYYDFGRDMFFFTYYPEALEECSCLHLLKYLAGSADPSLPSSDILRRLCLYAENPNFVLTEELLDTQAEQTGNQTPEYMKNTGRQNTRPDPEQDTYDFQDMSFDDEREPEDMPDEDFRQDDAPLPQDRYAYEAPRTTPYRPDPEEGYSRSRARAAAAKFNHTPSWKDPVIHQTGDSCGADPITKIPGSLSVICKSAVILLAVAAVLELLVQRVLFPQVSIERFLLPLQAGAITSLTVSVCLAGYAVILTIRDRKEARQLRLQEQEDARLNATIPTMEYRSSPRAVAPEEEDRYATAYEDNAFEQQKTPPPAPLSKLYGQGEARQYRIDLNRLPCVIGHNREFVDITIPASSVSALHARFSRNGEDIEMTDLNSRAGTFLNGVRLMPRETVVILPGDEIGIGRLLFIYR